MAIAFKCPKCQKPYKVKDDMAGKRVACVGCKAAMTVPRPSMSAAHPDAEEAALAALADEPAADATADAPAEGTFPGECPNCLETVAFPLKMAGKQAPCPACRRVVRVPQPADDRKKDWRGGPTKPAFARTDTEHIEGAWGNVTHTGVVGRDALLEAAVIKSRKDRELTTGQKATRLVIVLSIVALCVVGYLIYRSDKAVQQRDDYMDRALASSDADTSPVARAVLGRAAAEYYLRSRTPDAIKARDRLRAAYAAQPAAEPERAIERALTLGEAAVQACDLGGTEQQARDGVRLKWGEAQTELRRAFEALGRGDALGREGAMLAVARGTARLGPPANDRPDGFTLAKLTFGKGEPRDLTEATAAAALELLAAGEAVRTRVEEEAGRAAADPSSPRAVALLVALKKPVPSVPMPGTGEPQPLARLGYAEGLARAGDAENARRVAALPGRFEDRFAAHVAVAAGTGKAEDAQAAIAILESEIGGRDLPDWPLIRLGYVCAGLTESRPGEQLAGYLTRANAPTPKQQAVRAWVIALQMRAGHSALNEAAAKALPEGSAGALVAWEALARRDARAGTPPNVANWSDAAKPFGLAGSALGLLDRK